MHSYTPSWYEYTAPLMVSTEVVVPFVCSNVGGNREIIAGSVGVSMYMLLERVTPSRLQVKEGAGLPSEVQVSMISPPSMAVSIED